LGTTGAMATKTWNTIPAFLTKPPTKITFASWWGYVRMAKSLQKWKDKLTVGLGANKNIEDALVWENLGMYAFAWLVKSGVAAPVQ
jgi:hypothetical protein